MLDAFRAATLLIVVGCLWLALSALAAVPRVSIRNPGGVGSAPADWWITVTVEPHAEHRLLVIEADGVPGEYRRSDYRLEGARAARVRQIWFKAIGAGCYYFRATVADASHVLASVTSGPVRIIGRDGDQCPE